MNGGAGLDVSRETIERLKAYEALLRKWTQKINLVARSTLDDLWTRHFIDSAQIYSLAPHPVTHWADLGSGGGFPGLVIAIMAMEHQSPARVTLVESDSRKCTFLRTVIRETGAPAKVVNARIEETSPLEADVISARALTDLNGLLEFSARHLRSGGTAIFPKGESWQKELAAAQRTWNFSHQLATSETETGPVILTITGVARV